MYYGNPYGQPMYAPPQMINQGVPGVPGAPGSLYIPESSAPAYDPSTYEADPRDPADDFNKSNGNGRFFEADEDPVPLPNGGRTEDLGVQFSPGFESGGGLGMARPSSIQPVSATSAPVEYGFDRDNYRWLRGLLRYDPSSGGWQVTYSLAAKDRFGGRFILAASPGQLEEFRDGDMVDIHGSVDQELTDSLGRPLYRVDTIVRISM